MDVAVTGNHTAHQEALVRHAVKLTNERHLRIARWDHTWSVIIDDPANVDTTPHDSFFTFMVTTLDSGGITHIRNDMPFGGQGPWSGDKFFMESVIHELGHHLFLNIPPENQVELAQMFDADNTVDSLYPSGKSWLNKPGEGIAETFKDSFLAIQHRLYFNRTHELLAMHEYPAFRALWDPAEAPADIT